VRSASPLLLAAALAAGCGGTLDDLLPSSADRRPPVQAGTEGPAVGQLAPDFSLTDVATGTPVSLHAALSSSRGAVLYFTMWCPICDAHMTHLQWNAIPAHPGVRFFALDYVSGSAAQARAAQQAAGWDPTDFTVLADVGAQVERYYSAPMQIVIVGSDRVVRLNGEYDWPAVQAALGSLP
jgi:thiol-disulfide isomerase/thioredoxin